MNDPISRRRFLGTTAAIGATALARNVIIHTVDAADKRIFRADSGGHKRNS